MPLLLALLLARSKVEYTGAHERTLDEFVPTSTHSDLRYPERDAVPYRKTSANRANGLTRDRFPILTKNDDLTITIYLLNVYRIRNLPPRRAAVRPQGHAGYRASAPTVAVRQECVLTHTLSCIRLAVALAIPDTRRACAANSIRRRLLSAALRCHPASKTGSDQHKPAVHWAVAGGEHGA